MLSYVSRTFILAWICTTSNGINCAPVADPCEFCEGCEGGASSEGGAWCEEEGLSGDEREEMPFLMVCLSEGDTPHDCNSCVCVRVCVCVLCICVRTLQCVHVHVCVYTYVHVQVCMCKCVCTCMCVRMCVCVSPGR